MPEPTAQKASSLSDEIKPSQLVSEDIALSVPRFPSYEGCPAHLGRELNWQEAEQIATQIRARNPKRIFVERFAKTRCPHQECPYRISHINFDKPTELGAYCTYLDIVVKAAEAKFKGGIDLGKKII